MPAEAQKPEQWKGARVGTVSAVSSALSLPAVAALAGMVSLLTFPFITDFVGRLAVVVVTTIAISALKRNLELAQ